jgi:hypothetical protein
MDERTEYEDCNGVSALPDQQTKPRRSSLHRKATARPWQLMFMRGGRLELRARPQRDRLKWKERPQSVRSRGVTTMSCHRSG